MNAEVANIFDLLLGPISPDAAGCPGVSSQGADDAVFDSILTALMDFRATGDQIGVTGAPTTARPSHGLPEPNPEIWAQLLAQSLGTAKSGSGQSLDQGGVLSGGPLGGATDQFAQKLAGEAERRPFNIFALSEASIEPPLISGDQAGEISSVNRDEAQIAAENQVAFNRSLAEVLPRESRIVNHSLEYMLNSRPVDLVDDGQFRIMSVEQGSGLLHLALLDPTSPEKPIHVTVPLSSLADGLKGQSMTGSRVNLGSEQPTSLQLQRLLDRLNLKEITIKTASQNAVSRTDPETDDPPDLVKVTIVANDSSRRVVLRSQLSAEELRTPSPKGPAEPPTTDKITRPLSGDVRTPMRGEDTVIEPGRMVQAAVTGSGSPESRVGFDLLRPTGSRGIADQGLRGNESRLDSSWRNEVILSKSGAETTSGGSDHSSGELGSRDTGVLRQSNDSQPVRFHLPNNFQPALRNGRQSLTLRIDPEHLGPARLTLTERDGGLQARLIVNSPEAKALIESSLDRLSRQLQQANVDVESIEVTVSADSEHRQFFHERPEWTGRAVRPGQAQSDEETEQIGHVVVLPPPTSSGAGVGRVDLLA